jgi:hypothetical protein
MTPASSKSMLNADPSTPSVPNVVIGVTPSPSSVGEISSQLPSSVTKAEAAVQLELPTQAVATPSSPPVAVAATAVAPVRDTLVAPAMPPEASEDEHDGEDPASEERIRVAEKVVAPIEESRRDSNVEKVDANADANAEPPPNLHDTLIDAQKIEIVKPAVAPKHDDTFVDAKAPKIEEPVRSEAKPNFEKTLPFGSAEMLGAATKKDEPKVEAKKETEKPPVQDEETIPPAGDLAVSVVAEQFFSEGDVSRHAGADDDLDSLANDKAQRKSDPDVVKRRAKLAKYVTWAVGISAALCLIAVVRTTFSSSSKTISAANAASVKAKSEMAVKAKPPPAVAPAPKAAEPAAAPAPVETAKPVVTGDLKEEKAKVKAALEKNKLADAIEAGERAVMIDETDSEAWLLLGAAYHQKGNLKEAQRAYHACKERGTKDKFQRECALFAR